MGRFISWLASLADAAATTFTGEVARLAQVQPNGRTLGEVYRESLRNLSFAFLFASMFFPFLIVLLGHYEWVNVVAAGALVLWLLVTVVLWIAFAPIGFAAQILFGVTKVASIRYARTALGIALFECGFTLFAMLVDMKTHFVTFPLLFAAIIVLVVAKMGKFTGFFPWLAKAVSVCTILVLLVRFTLPNTFSSLQTVPDRLDASFAGVVSPSEPDPLDSVYTLNKGEVKHTIYIGRDVYVVVRSNHAFKIVSGTKGTDGYKEMLVTKGKHPLYFGDNAGSEGFLKVEGMYDGTELRFKKSK